MSDEARRTDSRLRVGLRSVATRLSGESRGYAILVIVYVVGVVIAPQIAGASTLRALTAQATPIVLAGTAEAVVLLIGELDLSVGATMALSGVVVISLLNRGFTPIAASAAAIAVGLVVGLVNGACVTGMRVSSFVVTLGSSFAVYGVALAASGGVIVAATRYGPTEWIASFTAQVITPPLPIALACIAVVAFAVRRTTWGRQLYAIGGHRESAARWGMRVSRRTIEVFALSGALAGVAGILLALALGTGDPNAGSQTLLDAIAGAVIGGVAITGGVGRIGAAACGALALVVLQFVLNERNVSSTVEQLLAGAVVLAVGLGPLQQSPAFQRLSLLVRPES